MDQGRVLVLICVIVITIGQILFKQVAVNYNKIGSLFDLRVLGILLVACIMYAISTGLWVWALRSMEISKAYPYFALGFVFVPLLGALFFGEVLSIRYGVGIIMIVTGVVMTTSSL
jgi:drug/metabolite transporter (DMT)-like permease